MWKNASLRQQQKPAFLSHTRHLVSKGPDPYLMNNSSAVSASKPIRQICARGDLEPTSCSQIVMASGEGCKGCINVPTIDCTTSAKISACGTTWGKEQSTCAPSCTLQPGDQFLCQSSPSACRQAVLPSPSSDLSSVAQTRVRQLFLDHPPLRWDQALLPSGKVALISAGISGETT